MHIVFETVDEAWISRQIREKKNEKKNNKKQTTKTKENDEYCTAFWFNMLFMRIEEL